MGVSDKSIYHSVIFQILLAMGLIAGMALDCYTNCTSPLRKYVDLLVHLQIKAVLSGTESLYVSAQILADLGERLPGGIPDDGDIVAVDDGSGHPVAGRHLGECGIDDRLQRIGGEKRAIECCGRREAGREADAARREVLLHLAEARILAAHGRQVGDDRRRERRERERTGQMAPGLTRARGKLEKKNLDLVVANEVAIGFGGDTNAAFLVPRSGEPVEVPHMFTSLRLRASRMSSRSSTHLSRLYLPAQ